MKKLLLLIITTCIASLGAWGQTSSVSATITDPTSQAYANGTYDILFRPAPGVPGNSTQNGSAFTKHFSGVLDASGAFAVTLTRNDFIQPGGSQWTFTICPLAASACFTSNQTIAAASVNLTTPLHTITPIVSVFSLGNIPAAYSSSEIVVTPNPGGFFWNLTTGTFNFWNGASWTAMLLPTANNTFSGTNTFTQFITFTNPASTTGTGQFIKNNAQWNNSITGFTTLLDFNFHNTGAVCCFYGLSVTSDSDTVDTSASAALFNNGKSDALYIGLAGKPGATASTPSGVGMDVNRNGNGENSSVMNGIGINAWDWSTTDQGLNGPQLIYLQKRNNRNSQHRMLHLDGNRSLFTMEIDPTTPGFLNSFQLMDVAEKGAGIQRWVLDANGDMTQRNAAGLFWNMPAGNQAFIRGDADNVLRLRGGTVGYDFRNNADNADNWQLLDNGTVNMRNGAPLAWLDSGGASTNILLLDGSNNVYLIGRPGTNTISLQPTASTTSLFLSGKAIAVQNNSRFKVQDQGTCTMSSGTCTLINLASTYASAPQCFVTWTGTGAMTGFLKSQRTTTTIQPASSVGTDTAQVDWACYGN